MARRRVWDHGEVQNAHDSVAEEAEPFIGADVALERLRALAYVERLLQEQADEWVLIARDAGASWSQVADAQGVDKSTAIRRAQRATAHVRPVDDQVLDDDGSGYDDDDYVETTV